MEGFREILVALEFNAAAQRVLSAAQRVAAPGARLRLLHVVEWVPAMVEGTLVRLANPRDTRRLHDESLGKLRSYAAKCGDFRAEPEVVEGEPAPAILEAAAQGGVDLLVMGRGRRRGIVSTHAGSLVDRVVAEAPCAVLLVPS